MADQPPPPLLDSHPQGAEDPDIHTRVSRVEVVVQEVIARMDRMQNAMDRGFAEVHAEQRQLQSSFNELRRDTTSAIDGLRHDTTAAIEAQRHENMAAFEAQRHENMAAFEALRQSQDALRREIFAVLDKMRDDNQSTTRWTMSTLLAILIALLGKVLNIY